MRSPKSGAICIHILIFCNKTIVSVKDVFYIIKHQIRSKRHKRNLNNQTLDELFVCFLIMRNIKKLFARRSFHGSYQIILCLKNFDTRCIQLHRVFTTTNITHNHNMNTSLSYELNESGCKLTFSF